MFKAYQSERRRSYNESDENDQEKTGTNKKTDFAGSNVIGVGLIPLTEAQKHAN